MSGNKANRHMKVTAAPTPDPNTHVEDVAFYAPNGANVIPGFMPVTSATAIGTAAKTTTASEPPAGTSIALTLTNGNSAASPTLAFNGGTARAIVLGGTASAAIEITVAAGGIVFLYFDGTSLHQFGVVS